MNWIEAISTYSTANQGFVVVTVLGTRGSAPRDQQSKMVVGETQTHDTIGGGNLEFRAIAHARRLLAQGVACNDRQQQTLGKDLSQCCGGQVELLYECFPACDFNVVVFGAGHIGRALVSVLQGLHCRVTWQDSREEVLTDAYGASGEPGNVTPRLARNPWEAVEAMPSDSWYLILTHSHEWDFDLVEAILSRRDAAFCGMIGSDSKAASFRGRLKRKGFSEPEVGYLVSPVGMDVGGGKLPMEVAVSIAGQLLSEYRLTRKRRSNLSVVEI